MKKEEFLQIAEDLQVDVSDSMFGDSSAIIEIGDVFDSKEQANQFVQKLKEVIEIYKNGDYA